MCVGNQKDALKRLREEADGWCLDHHPAGTTGGGCAIPEAYRFPTISILGWGWQISLPAFCSSGAVKRKTESLRGSDEGSTEGETGNRLLIGVSNLVVKKYRPSQ
jgi:hypothetical protein